MEANGMNANGKRKRRGPYGYKEIIRKQKVIKLREIN